MISGALEEFEKQALVGAALMTGLTGYAAYDDLRVGKKKSQMALSGKRGFRPLMQRGMYQLQSGRFNNLRRL